MSKTTSVSGLTDMAAPRPPQVLYLTAVDRDGGTAGLSRQTRVIVGVLARDMAVSLAIAGPIEHQALQSLREQFAPLRAAGGFPASSADQRAERGLRRLTLSRFGSDIINARLQAAIQRRSDAFDAIVIDELVASPYLPVNAGCPVYYLAHRCEADLGSQSPWRWLQLGNQRACKKTETQLAQSVSGVFATPAVASGLLAQGMSLSQLNPSFGRFRPEIAVSDTVDWNQTRSRLGYAGYLGDDRNLASLEWLLKEVWTPGQRIFEGTELHLVGTAPPAPLRELAAANNNVYLHSGGRQQLQFLGCRAVIEPLMFEQHVDTKLVNAMSHGLPVVTSQQALARAHTDLGNGVLAAGGPEQMAMLIQRVMKEREFWQRHADAAAGTAALQLPDYEVAHDLRRAVLKGQEGGVTA